MRYLKQILFGIITAGMAALAGALPAFAAQDDAARDAAKEDQVYRIGFITYASAGRHSAIKDELAKLGYEEGENVVYRTWAGNRDKSVMHGYAEELVAWDPDVIVSFMTSGHVAVQEATKRTQTPVVFWSADPLETGVIDSYRNPGTNFTGFTYEPYTQLLEIRFLKLAYPDLKCVGHLYNHTYAPAPSTLRDLKKAGEMMNVKVKVFETLKRENFEKSISGMKEAGCPAFIVGPHELFNTNGQAIGELALKYNMAAVGIQTSVTRGGGLATYSPPFGRGWPAMALVIDRIIKGERPQDIPIERSFKSPLTINLKAAKSLGLTLPDSLIDEADHLIE